MKIPEISRRQFVRTFSLATAVSTLGGRTWTDLVAAEIQPSATSNLGILQLRLEEFPALQAASGSVRLGVNPFRRSVDAWGKLAVAGLGIVAFLLTARALVGGVLQVAIAVLVILLGYGLYAWTRVLTDVERGAWKRMVASLRRESGETIP